MWWRPSAAASKWKTVWELIRDGNSWCVSWTYWTRKAVMTPASCSALQKTPIHCKAGGYTGWQFNSHQLFHIKRISTNWTKLRKSWDWKTPAKYLNSDNYKDNVYYPPFSLLPISVLFKKKNCLKLLSQTLENVTYPCTQFCFIVMLWL